MEDLVDGKAKARSTDDDRICVHAAGIVRLPAAEDIVFEDDSDPEVWETAVTAGLDEILKVKEEKEETSIGFRYYATAVTLNDALEIVKIHLAYDVMQ